jgi:hypothetical protein
MIVASAKGSYKVGAIVDSMRQLFGDRTDIPIASPSFHTQDVKARFCNYCKKKNHFEKDCWKKRKDLASKEENRKIKEQSKQDTYVSFLSTVEPAPIQAALIDSGAVHTVIGKATLDTMMGSLGIIQVKKCSPLSIIHRFGAHGTPIEPDFGVIIPWRVKNSTGDIISFNFRADVLDGNHPFLIGCPTLVSMKACLDFGELALTATINGVQSVLGLMKQGNHIYLEYEPTSSKETPVPRDQRLHEVSYYGQNIDEYAQFFRQLDHC